MASFIKTHDDSIDMNPKILTVNFFCPTETIFPPLKEE
jgi:hypothetical protein